MELQIYFASPIIYILATVFLCICGYMYWDLLTNFSEISFRAINLDRMIQAEHISANALVFTPLFSYMGFFLLLIIPLMTMRLFSEEKKIGTMEILLTYPTTNAEIVFGKFLASFTVLLILIGATFIYPLITRIYGAVRFAPLMVGYLGLLLQGLAIMSVGIFSSSLTENQVVAAIITYGVIVIFSSIQWTADFIPKVVSRVLEYISISTHSRSLINGVIDTRDVVYFLMFSFFFIWLTLKSLESERWRK
jgi:ABC-2 type transport system permease protein